MDLEELPPAGRPAEGEGDGARIIRDGVLFAGQPLEAAPAVDLEHAGVVGQHLSGTVPDPVLGVDVGHRRRQVAPPGAVVAGKAPEITGARFALAGRQYRQAWVIAEQLGRTHHAAEQRGATPPRAGPPAPPAVGPTTPSGPSSPTEWRGRDGRRRAPGSGPDGTAASRRCTSPPPPGPATPRSAGRRGRHCPAPEPARPPRRSSGSRRSDAW